MKKEYKVKLSIITPVIIHTGEYYDFINVIPSDRNNTVDILNIPVMLSLMSPAEEKTFFDLANTHRNKELLHYLKQFSLSHPEIIIRKCTSYGEFNDEVLKNPNCAINKIHFNEVSGKAVIPGSSIKGAIRTALLEKIRKDSEISPKEYNKWIKTADFELKLLENNQLSKQFVSNDPFKFLKVSDFTLETEGYNFSTVRVINRSGAVGKGIPVYTEMTPSYLLNGGKPIIAHGTISIESEVQLNRYDYNDLFTIENIIASLDDFTDINFKNAIHPISDKVIKAIENYGYEDGQALFRIGRFTQIESKTFKVRRDGEFGRNGRPLNPDINIEGGISRSLIDGEISAGFCIMSVSDHNNNHLLKSNQVNLPEQKKKEIPIVEKTNERHNNQTVYSTGNQKAYPRPYKDGETVEIKITSVGNPFSNAETTDKHVKGSIPIKELANRFISDPNEIIKVGDIKKAIVSYRIDNNGREHLNFSLKGYEKQKNNQYMI